jgi:hypothetical protein
MFPREIAIVAAFLFKLQMLQACRIEETTISFGSLK